MRPHILLIDDQWGKVEDPTIEETYGSLPLNWSKSTSYERQGIYSVEVAIADTISIKPDLVLLDIYFGEGSPTLGVDILSRLRHSFPTLPILMFTTVDSRENRELVVRCLEIGANEYIEKLPTPEFLHQIIKAYVDPSENSAIYGNTVVIKELRATIARICFSEASSILVTGESGTGKELIARALHRLGTRKNGPFVAKNCAHTQSELLDSELFGHEKGAFTGAVASRKGLLEEANHGILFLDEVSDMPLVVQAKLLRVLETRVFRRVGGNQDISTSFQLICATNQPAEALVRAGTMREDFFYRIATLSLKAPALIDRVSDIELLANMFLKRFVDYSGASYPARKFSKSFVESMNNQLWPGNVRELKNYVERSVILSTSSTIEPDARDQFSAPVVSEKIMPASVDVFSEFDDSPASRIRAELQIALSVKRHIRAYKGSRWRAEFMRTLYPDCKAANAKGFSDLVHRLKGGPWGYKKWNEHTDLCDLFEELEDEN